MKSRLLTLILLLMPLVMSAQDLTTDFLAEGNSLVWKKVYHQNTTIENLANALRSEGKVSEVVIVGDLITCSIPQTPFAIKEAGFTRGGVPMYISLNDITGFAKIQVKDGRYRVTVSDFILVANQDTSLGRAGEKMGIELYAVKNGKLKNSVYKILNPILGQWLADIFDYNNIISSIDNDW